MAKLFTTQELLTLHGAMRSIVSDISKQTHTVKHQAAKAKADAEKLYANSGLSKTEIRNIVNKHVRAFVDTQAKPIRELLKPKLRDMEGIRLQLEEARDNMTNKVRRLNAFTVMDKKLKQQRFEAMQLTDGAQAIELEVLADAAKVSGDLGMLAAIVARNNKLSAKERSFTNAELLADVDLPGQDDIDAVYAEAVSLPAFAVSCDRAFDRLGKIKPEDKLANALAERNVKLNEDGSLANFVANQSNDHVEPNPGIERERVDPKNHDSWASFSDAGGNFDDLTEKDMVRFWPMDDSVGGDA